MRYNISFLVLVGLFGAQMAYAEAWLGSRYAQNCAGCHAPGRKNLQPMERRCTLSCQGCHVNPSGGGMRNFYGRWNQDRWLRSYRLSVEKATKSTAPIKRQHYGKKKYRRVKGKDTSWIYNEGLPLVEVEAVSPPEQRYDRSDRLEYTTAKTWKEFLYQVPMNDPYRQFDYSRTDAGGDIRWLWRSLQSESNSNDEVVDSAAEWQNFMMSFDAGVRYRPFHRYFHLVYEGRIMGNPAEDAQFKDTANTAGTRSLYAMVDNLPYNTYIQGGWYRPLINQTNPDHNALAQRMLASTIIGSPRAQSLLFNAVTVGTAPNVPFANLHYIMRRKVIGGDFEGDRTRGFAANVGLRFVTLGAAVNYTYWRTTDTNDRTGAKTDTEILAFGTSAQLWRVTAGLELLSLTRDAFDEDFRRGGVISWESRLQTWRQNYLILHYATANRAVDLQPGTANQMKFGYRGFHLAGMDTTLTYDIDEETVDGEKNSVKNTRKTAYLTGQMHVYF